MTQNNKVLYSILSGNQDNNIKFSDLQKLLKAFGFSYRVKGDHFIYVMDGIEEIINIQPKANRAKSYQVKQVRNIILKYKLSLEE